MLAVVALLLAVAAPEERAAPGRHQRTGKCGLAYALFVPPGAPAEGGYPLLVAMHGTGGRGEHMLSWFEPLCGPRGWLILSPSSTGRVWDHGDTEKVAALVRELKAELPIWDKSVFVIGFSNGATWNYHLAFNHPELFRGVISLMGGLLQAMGAPVEANRGMPVYIVNGAKDEIVPLRTARRSVNRLQGAGFNVVYKEYPEMGHVVPWNEFPLIFAWMMRKVGRLERPGADANLMWRSLEEMTIEDLRAQGRVALVYFYRSRKPTDPVPLHLETVVFPDEKVRAAAKDVVCVSGDLERCAYWAKSLGIDHAGLAIVGPDGVVQKKIAGAPAPARVAELLRAATGPPK